VVDTSFIFTLLIFFKNDILMYLIYYPFINVLRGQISWTHMSKLKFINKFMICWKKVCIIWIHKTNESFEYKRYILFTLYYPQKFSIYKSCVWIIFFQKMIIEILFNNKIQFFSFQIIRFFTHIYIIVCVHYWRNFMNHFFIWTIYQ